MIPSQGTCLGCRFVPQSGHVQETTDLWFSLTLMILSLSFSPSSPLSRIKKKITGKGLMDMDNSVVLEGVVVGVEGEEGIR